ISAMPYNRQSLIDAATVGLDEAVTVDSQTSALPFLKKPLLIPKRANKRRKHIDKITVVHLTRSTRRNVHGRRA
ncbi:MAG: hypothetical protein NZ743_04070, partial [Pseudomonadales bacterium]|nr:hypothetical protein [Pseudomonadales bacterium]